MQLNQPQRAMFLALAGAILSSAAFYAWHTATAPFISRATLTVPPTTRVDQVAQGAQRALSRKSLKDVIDRNGLFRGAIPMEDEIEFLRRNVRISSVAGDGSVQLVYHHENPGKARAVTADLAGMLAKQVDGAHVSQAPRAGTPDQVSLQFLTAGGLLGLFAGLGVAWILRPRTAS